MRNTKKITLSAMMTALGVVLMTLGYFVQVLDLTVAALASLIIAFVYIEIGSPYVFFVWLGTALLSFIFFPSSLVWLEYLMIFGVYPILKAYIERLPRKFWFILKLLLANAMIAVLLLLSELLTGVPFLEDGAKLFGFIEGKALVIVSWVIMNIAGVAYDMFLTVMVRIYMVRYRDRFKKFLK